MTKILHPDDLRARGIRYSVSQRRRLEMAGLFPKRIRLGGPDSARYGYVESEIEAYVKGLIAERDGGVQQVSDVR
jgi:predicted DNA-binding transcriptional regulator AlpA